MTSTYNYYIVALSILIAILASYSALNITTKISNTNGKPRIFWLLTGSFVMGSGIWSMHFVGMLALHINMAVKYDVKLTLLSLMTSVFSSFIAFLITLPSNINWYKIFFGGLFMGSGIVSMHYLGMEAMSMPAQISYDPFIKLLSVLIAIIVSYVALLLFLRFRNQPSSNLLKWVAAIVMGFAVFGMHYTGMKATTFQVDTNMIMKHDYYIDLYLLYGVTVAIFFIFFISWGSMFFDRHVLEKMAYQDSITLLPNRNEMNRFFSKQISGESLCVLYLDLDQFKAINDTLGHDMGDLLIKEVGSRLRTFTQKEIQAYRIGGDEFLIIAKNYDPDQAIFLANNILNSIKKVYLIEGIELYVTGSIGISLGSVQSSNRTILLRTADTAMYKAKVLGKNRYYMYDEKIGIEVVRKMELEKDLQGAILSKQLYMVYQPKWNVKTNSVCGFEALIRWEHPRLGLISPIEFISIAEENGLIIPITRWTMEQACSQCKDWQRQGIIQPISVNLSSLLFQKGNLFEIVQSVLKGVDLEPHFLELEITESIVLTNVEYIICQLQNIRSLGVKVSMDDFGTGYSSIGLLDRIPLDTIKLDRLFTNDLETPNKRAIIQAIMLMTENLKLDVIAEGVETQEQIDLLTELGCHLMQGYFYGKPMKSSDVNEWIEERK